MATQLIIGEDVFDELAGEWDELAGRGMTDTPFQTSAYQKAWWTHLHPQDATLLTVVVRDTRNFLQAIGCFYSIAGSLYFNGCVEETDYLDLITPADLAPDSWRAVMECLSSEQAIPWHSLELCNVPATSPSRSVLPELAKQMGYSYDEQLAEVCPVITLPDDFETYLETLDSKQRREISRKLRRAEAAEMETIIVGRDDPLDEPVEIFLDLLQKSTFEKRDWLHEGRRAVFHEVAGAAQKAGTLQLMFAAIEDRRAASLFNFDYKGRIWVYNSGLDPNLFASLSPGVVLTAWSIEHAIKSGRVEFDFLRGDEEYKYRFGAVDTEIFRIHIGRE